MEEWVRGELEEDAKLDADTLDTDVWISDDDLREVLRLAKRTADPFDTAGCNIKDEESLIMSKHRQMTDTDDDNDVPMIPPSTAGAVDDAPSPGDRDDKMIDNSPSNQWEELVKCTSSALEAFESAVSASKAEVLPMLAFVHVFM